MPGASPNAMFSLLAPRTRIPPHTGVANTRLVCHLPLIVPADCGFRCGETIREWRVGEAFVFDDTIEHEAWNDSDQLRVVLIIDLWAPALGRRERDAVAAVIGASGASFRETDDRRGPHQRRSGAGSRSGDRGAQPPGAGSRSRMSSAR